MMWGRREGSDGEEVSTNPANNSEQQLSVSTALSSSQKNKQIEPAKTKEENTQIRSHAILWENFVRSPTYRFTDPLYASAWNPYLFLFSLMYSPQCVFYLTMGILLGSFRLIFGSRVDLAIFFDYSLVAFGTSPGLLTVFVHCIPSFVGYILILPILSAPLNLFLGVFL